MLKLYFKTNLQDTNIIETSKMSVQTWCWDYKLQVNDKKLFSTYLLKLFKSVQVKSVYNSIYIYLHTFGQ